MTGRPRGAPRSERARQAILDATAQMLAERGWDQLTIESIAATARVGKPTIYRWWSSKSALIAEALLEDRLVVRAPEPGDSGDLRADLGAWLDATLRMAAVPEATALIRALIAAGSEDEEVGARLDRGLETTRLLRARLRLAAERGESVRVRDVDATADALIGALVLRVMQRTPYRPDSAARLVEAVLGAEG